MKQQRLDVTTDIDLRRFIHFARDPNPSPVMVGGMPGAGRRGGEVGTAIGVIGLKHVNGYEVLVEFSDGKIESFNPMELFPAEVAA